MLIIGYLIREILIILTQRGRPSSSQSGGITIDYLSSQGELNKECKEFLSLYLLFPLFQGGFVSVLLVPSSHCSLVPRIIVQI